MKSHSSDKKHGKSDNHKSNHKADHKSDHKDNHKDHKGDHRGEHKADKHAEKHAEKPHAEEKAGKGKKEKGRAVAAVAVPAGQALHAAAEKPTRLALIKARHEAMKREIDQIREDLESDEDE